MSKIVIAILLISLFQLVFNQNCTQFGQFCSNCTQTECLACKSNVFWGQNCEFNCTEGCGSCNKTDGSCDQCRTLTWGDSCNQTCPDACSGQCRKNNGTCKSCVEGWGPDCTKNCSETCRYSKCRQENGTCKDCVNGFWGPFCNNNCSENCARCYQEDGDCLICKSGYFGDKCEGKCLDKCKTCVDNSTCSFCKSEFDYGDSCQNTCSNNCTQYFGKYCSEDSYGMCLKCNSSRYGPFCEYNNTSGCFPSRNGYCSYCNTGFWGQSCENSCGNSTRSCDFDSGEDKSCPAGKYGKSCEKYCASDCKTTDCCYWNRELPSMRLPLRKNPQGGFTSMVSIGGQTFEILILTNVSSPLMIPNPNANFSIYSEISPKYDPKLSTTVNYNDSSNYYLEFGSYLFNNSVLIKDTLAYNSKKTQIPFVLFGENNYYQFKQRISGFLGLTLDSEFFTHLLKFHVINRRVYYISEKNSQGGYDLVIGDIPKQAKIDRPMRCYPSSCYSDGITHSSMSKGYRYYVKIYLNDTSSDEFLMGDDKLRRFFKKDYFKGVLNKKCYVQYSLAYCNSDFSINTLPDFGIVIGNTTFFFKPEEIFENTSGERNYLKAKFSSLLTNSINIKPSMMDKLAFIKYSNSEVGLAGGNSKIQYLELEYLPKDDNDDNDDGDRDMSGYTIGYIVIGCFVVISLLGIVIYYFYDKRRNSAVVSTLRLI